MSGEPSNTAPEGPAGEATLLLARTAIRSEVPSERGAGGRPHRKLASAHTRKRYDQATHGRCLVATGSAVSTPLRCGGGGAAARRRALTEDFDGGREGSDGVGRRFAAVAARDGRERS